MEIRQFQLAFSGEVHGTLMFFFDLFSHMYLRVVALERVTLSHLFDPPGDLSHIVASSRDATFVYAGRESP